VAVAPLTSSKGATCGRKNASFSHHAQPEVLSLPKGNMPQLHA
jgi:hypothetical protein